MICLEAWFTTAKNFTGYSVVIVDPSHPKIVSAAELLPSVEQQRSCAAVYVYDVRNYWEGTGPL